MTCYQCIHNFVCMYFKKWEEGFPYKNDGHISPYLDGIAKTLAENCKFYLEIRNNSKPVEAKKA